jgi:hypothetical protein
MGVARDRVVHGLCHRCATTRASRGRRRGLQWIGRLFSRPVHCMSTPLARRLHVACCCALRFFPMLMSNTSHGPAGTSSQPARPCLLVRRYEAPRAICGHHSFVLRTRWWIPIQECWSAETRQYHRTTSTAVGTIAPMGYLFFAYFDLARIRLPYLKKMYLSSSVNIAIHGTGN